MFNRRALVILAIALAGMACLIALDFRPPYPFLRLKNSYADALARAGKKTPANPDLVFMAIESESVGVDGELDIERGFELGPNDGKERRALQLMSSKFPWPRETYGLILERLIHSGARVVIFDLTFPTSTEGDEPFRSALDRFRDHVVIGSNFVQSSGLRASHTRPAETLLPQETIIDDRIGFTNFWPDEDEVVRRAQYRVTVEQVQGDNPQSDSEVFLSLAARGLIKAGFEAAVPTGAGQQMFRFTSAPREGFPPHSIFEIFVPKYWQHNYQSGEFFRGKIVLVGAEGNWQHDEHSTPLGSMPGPEIHLNAINAALHGEFIRELSPNFGLALIVCAGLIAIALSLLIRSPWLRLLALGAVNCAAAWGALLAFNHASVLLPLVAPGAELNFTILLGLVSDLTLERVEKNRVRRTLEKYVSKNVVRELLDQPKLYAQSLGGVLKPATILFSDIRGYSFVTARSDPQALVAQLNEYLTAMVECVFRFGGTLDKFIGDAVMAVWGNTHSEGVRNDATNAVRAALAMKQELARLNRGWAAKGLPQLRIGVALNHGEVVVGNIGSPQRMEFTVIGEAVNVSWKLQELTKDLGADLIVGKDVMALVIEEFELRPLGLATIKGVPEPVEIFEVCGAIAPQTASLSAAGLL
ncbi:MAG: hypothetical protein DLM73_16515 [Chthoniobacterales bacterium]|nr:MAG: hypothetical protein DLM73_16515 [Chthoniobacterales bacterium]